MSLKLSFKLLVLLTAGLAAAGSMRGATNSASTNRVLVIDASSMPIAAGKVTLIIGTLLRTNGIYCGDYKIKVAPYFYKNEKGRLSITVTDESLTLLSHGKVATVIGTSTTTGNSGKSRHIDATATPADIDHGKLKLWFLAGDKKMTFEPAYRFAGNGQAAISATNETKLASESNRNPPIYHRNNKD